MKAVFLMIVSLMCIPLTLFSQATDPVKQKSPSETSEKKSEDTNKKDEKKIAPPKIGNFSLRTSQQPGSFIGFGENIIEEGQTQIFLFADAVIARRSHKTDVFPSILYGVTDTFSIFFNVPFSPGNRQECHHSDGMEDIYLQLEYAFYNKQTKCFVDQATLVGNITLPTGSAHKVPPTGFGAPSVFLGLTYNRMLIDWFYFGSAGIVLTTSYKHTKFGNQYFYECGFGRNFWTPPGWIFAWMVEVDGQYSEMNQIDGKIDRNSGGNTVYVTPSLWISNEKLILQLGVGFPAQQHLFGKQPRQYYTLNLNVGWTF